MGKESRTKNSFFNITFALANRVVSILTSFVNRTLFIYLLGDVALGLNSLFSTVLTVLSLSELGISSAITYHLYKPIGQNDLPRLRELTALYRRCYKVIGIAMLVIGLALMPVLDKLVNFPENLEIDVNIYVVYFLVLLRSVLSYLFYGFSQSIIEANQKQRVISIYTMVASIVTTALIAVGLALTKEYYIFLAIMIVMEIAKNAFLYIYSKNHYDYVTGLTNVKVSKQIKRSVFKDVYSIFVFKVTITIGQSIDSILISIMLGTLIVGYYGNYSMIASYVVAVITMIINSLGGSVGNLVATETKEYSHKVFLKIDFVNFVLMAIVTVCLFQLSNPFISLWLHDEKYLLNESVVVLLCANNYIISSMNAIYVFRNAFGLFNYGKYNFLFCGISNLILSIVMCKYFGIVGVLFATLISYFVISTFPFPYYLYTKGFNRSPRKYVIEMVLRYALLVAIAIVCRGVCSSAFKENTWMTFVGSGVICVIITVALISAVYFKTERFRSLISDVGSFISRQR